MLFKRSNMSAAVLTKLEGKHSVTHCMFQFSTCSASNLIFHKTKLCFHVRRCDDNRIKISLYFGTTTTVTWWRCPLSLTLGQFYGPRHWWAGVHRIWEPSDLCLWVFLYTVNTLDSHDCFLRGEAVRNPALTGAAVTPLLAFQDNGISGIIQQTNMWFYSANQTFFLTSFRPLWSTKTLQYVWVKVCFTPATKWNRWRDAHILMQS